MVKLYRALSILSLITVSYAYGKQVDNGPCPADVNAEGYCIELHNTGQLNLSFHSHHMFEDGVRVVTPGAYSHFYLQKLIPNYNHQVIISSPVEHSKIDALCAQKAYGPALAQGESFVLASLNPEKVSLAFGFNKTLDTNQYTLSNCQ